MTLDPSQLVSDRPCARRRSTCIHAIARFPRARFDAYVWTIGFPPGRVRDSELIPVWASDRSALYRVKQRAALTNP